MTLRKHFPLSIGCGALFFLAATAVCRGAEPGTLYLGASIGDVEFDYSGEQCTRDVQNYGFSGFCQADTDSNGFDLFFGYNLSPSIAVELGFADLGSAKYHVSNGNFRNVADGELMSQALHLDLVGNLPLGNTPGMVLSARLGTYSAHTTNSVSGSGSSANVSADNDGIHFGVGGSYYFTRTDAFRLMLERYDQVGSNTTGQADVDMLSIGFVHNF